MTQTIARRPAGIPTGGQFAPSSHGESEVSLDGGVTAPTTGNVSFADYDREQRIEAMRGEIDDAMANLSNGDGWRDYLESASKFHHYSLNNQLLIAVQRPDATRVAGFKAWQKDHERTVRKGSKAIWVLAPMTRTITDKDAAGDEQKRSIITGFRPVSVFDVSDTDGKELPGMPAIPARELADAPPPEGMVEHLDDYFDKQGFAVSYEELEPGHGGYTDFGSNRVVINSTYTPREQARVKAHEAGHIACGHDEQVREYHSRPGGKRPDMEVEAESVAYVVGRHFGMSDDEMGGRSFNYIDGWASGDSERVAKTATRVTAACKTLLAGS